MRMLKLFLLLVLVGFSAPKKALADEAGAHFMAHFGGSYMINTISYGFYRRAFRMDATSAMIASSCTTLLIGFTYKYMQAMEEGQMPANTGKAMLQNLGGVAASNVSIFMFKFDL